MPRVVIMIIQVNNGQKETLIQTLDGFGLFQSATYKVVRQLNKITEKEIICNKQNVADQPNQKQLHLDLG